MRFIILLALLGCALAVPKHVNRIVGGSPTTAEEYPYISNMQYGWFGGWFWSQSCGGSLITPTSVLSAAHCYAGDRAADWRVALGATNRDGLDGAIHSVARLVVHAGYNSQTIDNDIAIVVLTSAATLSNSVGTVRVAGYNVADNALLYTIGWGTLSSGGASPIQLQHVDLFAINQEICAERYRQLKEQPGYAGWPDITERMLCAGVLDVGGRDACQGDSGGPLVEKESETDHNLVGITSWGFGCAHDIYPGVNARVSTFTDWIVSNVG